MAHDDGGPACRLVRKHAHRSEEYGAEEQADGGGQRDRDDRAIAASQTGAAEVMSEIIAGGAPIEALREYGYYVYAGRIYFNKYDLFDAALARWDWSPAIEFVFPLADELGDTTVEPELSLVDLYKARALELRGRFDYLILMYSGGADSHQVLMSFLNNGIFLDEVRTVFPVQFASTLTEENPSPRDPLGLIYEYKLAVLPALQMVSLRSPGTRIVVQDLTDDCMALSEWRNSLIAPRVTGGLHGLYHGIRRAATMRELQRFAEGMGASTVGVIYGSEKPYPRLTDYRLDLFFSDVSRIGIEGWWHYRGQLRYRPVMFYWGDPRISVKQGHVVLKAMRAKPEAVASMRANDMMNVHFGLVPGMNRALLYPDWDNRYRKPQVIRDDALLPALVGNRAAEAAAERTRYYNQRFGRLVRPIVDEPQTRVMMSETQTRLYPLGSVADV